MTVNDYRLICDSCSGQGDNLRNPGRIARADLADVVISAIKNKNSWGKTVEVSVDNTIKPRPDDLDHLFDDTK